MITTVFTFREKFKMQDVNEREIANTWTPAKPNKGNTDDTDWRDMRP